jgi:hypothetical protein
MKDILKEVIAALIAFVLGPVAVYVIAMMFGLLVKYNTPILRVLTLILCGGWVWYALHKTAWIRLALLIGGLSFTVLAYLMLVSYQPWCSQEAILFRAELLDTSEALSIIDNQVDITKPDVLLKINAFPESRFNNEQILESEFDCEWHIEGDGEIREEKECSILFMSGADKIDDLINVNLSQPSCTQIYLKTLLVHPN